MFTNKATTATPPPVQTSPNHRPWIWEQISSAVPELPCGAITLILLLGKDPEKQHERMVEDLVGCTLDHHQSLTYVAVDYTPGHLADSTGPRILGIGDDRAGVIIDTDLTVMARTEDGNCYPYGCGLPTLGAVELQLAQVADAGQRLVILDGFQRARPYRAEGESLVPTGLPLTVDAVDAWRSADLLDFARARNQAPTVVVWNGAGVEGERTKMSIGAIADVVVACHIATNIVTVNTKGPDGEWEYAALR